MGDTAGALWAYVMEPDAAHEVARSRDLAVILYEEALARRLPEGAKDLKPLNADAGIFGDAKLNTLTPVAGNEPPLIPANSRSDDGSSGCASSR